ncbi:MAG: DEAD/DEAH box helicase, partial [Bacteroidota bacterium]
AKLVLRSQDESSDFLQKLDAVESIEILVDEEIDFLNATFRNNRGKTWYSFDHLEGLLNGLQEISFSKLALYSPHVKSLYLCYLLSEKLVQQSAIIPQLLRIGARRFRIRWIPAMLNQKVRQQLEDLAQLIPADLIFRKKGKEILSAVAEEHLVQLLSLFIGHRVQSSHALSVRRMEHNIVQLFFNQSIESFSTYEEQGFAEAIQLWLSKFFIAEKDLVPVIIVSEEEEGFEVTLGAEDQKQSLPAPIPLVEILSDRKYQKNRIPLLRDLTMLADYFPQIGQVVASQGKEGLFFDNEQFANILLRILPTIRLFGIKVLLPKALRKLLRPQISLALDASDDGTVHSNGLVNMDNMLSFNWQVAIGDQLLAANAFLKLVDQYSGIVKLNDQYVFFDEKQIQALLKQMKQAPALKANELLQVALTEEYEGAKVGLSKMAKKKIDALRKKKKVRVPKGLKAKLRPYQQSGYEWMYKNANLGFGSLIADDMGLGKTLQVICTLLKWKEEGHLATAKALIIVPTSLLTNWVKEMAKFAPQLLPHVFHGPKRALDGLISSDILLTTYGVLRSDLKKLEKRKWQVVVIDEAQNIKNPSTAQTKAVKKIKAPIKIAMSGTPVENRLSEYWSIFDFTNQQYLGNLSRFKDQFARPIEVDRDQQKLDHFRKITQPFILRRLKSDKSIIDDLPDKIEKDQFCQLTPEQAALYESIVETTMQKIERSKGIDRRGMVLKLITALKQICNHPAQFLKKGNRDAAFSGKGKMLVDLLKQILDNGEKTLIFTQYQEMGQLIIQMMKDYFDQEVPFLHGGVSRKKRDEMVDDFQNNRSTRVFILSLKAAGTGLNLTAANNVIHYDLWWNPAVEAQATDRAYRIGQQNKVMVHRFITEHTFEEKINQLLQSKKELADLTVSTGEKWIGNFSDQELRDLVRLEV